MDGVTAALGRGLRYVPVQLRMGPGAEAVTIAAEGCLCAELYELCGLCAYVAGPSQEEDSVAKRELDRYCREYRLCWPMALSRGCYSCLHDVCIWCGNLGVVDTREERAQHGLAKFMDPDEPVENPQDTTHGFV